MDIIEHKIKKTINIKCGEVYCFDCEQSGHFGAYSEVMIEVCRLFNEDTYGRRCLECLKLDKPQRGTWQWAYIQALEGKTVVNKNTGEAYKCKNHTDTIHRIGDKDIWSFVKHWREGTAPEGWEIK